MQGIQFVTNDKGEKTAVLIDLREYGELWEDIYDTLTARARASEPREGLTTVKERMRHAQSHLYRNTSRSTTSPSGPAEPRPSRLLDKT